MIIRTNPRPFTAARLLAVMAVMALATAPALADKLIVFTNGKVLRAKEISSEGAWTLADLGKGATVGVRTADILRIEDAVGDDKASGYNLASTENRGVSRSSGRANRRDRSSEDRAASVQERIEQRQQELEEKRNNARDRDRDSGRNPRQPFNNNNRGFRRSRLPGAMGQRLATDQRVVKPSRGDDN